MSTGFLQGQVILAPGDKAQVESDQPLDPMT
jgi:hypothetical protein